MLEQKKKKMFDLFMIYQFEVSRGFLLNILFEENGTCYWHFEQE